MNSFKTLRRFLNRQRWLPYLLLACLMTACAQGLQAAHWRWADFIDTLALDECFELRGPLPPAVATALPETKDFYLIALTHDVPRPHIAKLVRLLSKAKVVALDLMFVNHADELIASEEHLYRKELLQWKADTDTLTEAFKDAKNVVVGTWPETRRIPIPGAVGKTKTDIIWQQPAPALWNAARFRAHLRVAVSPQDGIVRRVSVFENTPTSLDAPAQRTPSLSLAVAAGALGLSARDVDKLQINDGWLKLGSRRHYVGPDGLMTIHYLGKRDCFDNNEVRYHYNVALDNYTPDDFAGGIVFVGRTDFKSKDDITTPYGDMSGIMVHMNAVATLLSGSGPPIPLPPWQTMLIALVCSVILIFPLLRLPLWGSLAAAAALCALVFLACATLFIKRHSYFPFSVPVLAVFLTYNCVALYEYSRARAMLGRFVGQDLASALLHPMRDLSLGGRTEVATALFCDLRRFSAATERLSPEAVEPLLNAYTNAVSETALRHGGRVIDYFGDGVFVLFRKNPAGADHALQAALAALEAEKATRVLLAEWSARTGVAMHISVGIHTGSMHIGVVGSEEHMKLGAVGDAVNVTSRVQGLTARCGFSILVTRECYDLIAGRIPFTPCGFFAVKGRDQEVEVFGAGDKQEIPTVDVPLQSPMLLDAATDIRAEAINL